jgi:hypothetical protein
VLISWLIMASPSLVSIGGHLCLTLLTLTSSWIDLVVLVYDFLSFFFVFFVWCVCFSWVWSRPPACIFPPFIYIIL